VAAAAVVGLGLGPSVDDSRLREEQAAADARSCLSLLERSSAARVGPALVDPARGGAFADRLWLPAKRIDLDPTAFYDRASATLDPSRFQGPPRGKTALIERCGKATTAL
jgi:hypothetical protein